MISRIQGKLIKCEANKVFLAREGLSYEIDVCCPTANILGEKVNENLEFIIYHYFNIEGNRGVPILIGFLDELERDFFKAFIKISGIGPKAALRAFDKPISAIARAIEEGDFDFLTTLSGIGKQRARQIVAALQGKVGRFALIPRKDGKGFGAREKEAANDAKEVLKRLQYNAKEIENMIRGALKAKPEIDSVEELLNEIYRQRK